MPARKETPALGSLRALAAARVAAIGLRATAREIGVRPFGLQGFLEGSKPHTATRRKLQDWHLASGEDHPDVASGESELVALEVLIRGIPEPKRAEALHTTVGFFGRLYDTMNVARPSWLQELTRDT